MKTGLIKTGLVALLALAASVPSRAVFSERDLAQTLHVLRYELCKSYSEMEEFQASLSMRDDRQHEELVRQIKICNELSLMLYSQKQDFTFDLTYALQQVSDGYRSFTKKRLPYDNVIAYLNVEIDRYERLSRTLRMLPPEPEALRDSLDHELADSLLSAFGGEFLPAILSGPEDAGERIRRDAFSLDSLSRGDRDSCLFYAARLLDAFSVIRDRLVADSVQYDITEKRLREAYDYARERYRIVQRRIFLKGQSDYWRVLNNLKAYCAKAADDFSDRYGKANFAEVRSEWRGPIVLGFSFFMLGYLLLATLLSTMIVKLLKKRVRLFQTPEFRKREFAILLLFSVILFIIVSLVARRTALTTHFLEMAITLLIEFSLLVTAVLVSLLIRHAGEQINDGLKLYTPVMLMGLVIITFRIIFIPNSLITLVFPPLLLVFGFWQYMFLKRNGGNVPGIDKIYASASFSVTLAAFVLSVIGFALLSLQVCIWWIFQLTLLLLISACHDLLRRYRNERIERQVRIYRKKRKEDPAGNPGAYFPVTWLYDFADKVLMPLLALLSVPFCLYLASEVFDLSEVCMDLFFRPFLRYGEHFQLSAYKMVLAAGLFFIFRYLTYAAKSLYKVYKMQRHDANLTLGNNLIGILVWGIYVIVTVSLLKIPTKSLTVITAALVAGLGFAMKDILNNFFYGVQLMSGRLRVGDYIECDGFRGKVDSIGYQSTDILAADGSVMAFPNSSLFAKTFRNLTKVRSYEYVAIPVDVAYGTEVETARNVIVEALGPLRQPEGSGRPVVEEKYGIQVAMSGFGESSVSLVVKQYVLVEQRFAYVAKANERIYKALNENGIEIPFPQRDIHIKQD